MRERQIERYLIRKVKEKGGEVRKLKYIGRRGAVDRLVLLPGRFFMIELKRPGLTAEAHQAREHARLRASGIVTYVLDSFESIDEVLS